MSNLTHFWYYLIGIQFGVKNYCLHSSNNDMLDWFLCRSNSVHRDVEPSQDWSHRKDAQAECSATPTAIREAT